MQRYRNGLPVMVKTSHNTVVVQAGEGNMYPDPAGEWCRVEDVLKLQQEIAELKESLEDCKSSLSWTEDRLADAQATLDAF